MPATANPIDTTISKRIVELTSLLDRQTKAIDQLIEHRKQLKRELLVMKEQKLSDMRRPVATA